MVRPLRSPALRPGRKPWITGTMTDLQDPKLRFPLRAARLFMALLLVLLVATLPGPRVSVEVQHPQQLVAPSLSLTAIHGRDQLARKETAQVQPLTAAALPPSETPAAPPRTAAAAGYTYHHLIGAPLCALAPCARAPPVFRMTA
ncbi:hypothetical protein GCM10017635_06260 [Paracoccus kondratievae]|uniref:Uncharacterized protein n=2 Tax=Paracoccus kondratievae TaxID=135740 RepID=A0AAD3NWF6_9RHOB|nr:hypothetical protein GCM10017635_06260 [Paracoccus kondratievae]